MVQRRRTADSGLLTLARDLRRRKARERRALFVAEGVRVVEELVRSPVEIRGVVATREAGASPRGAALLAALERRGIALKSVSTRDFASAADTEHPQGVLAVAREPRHTLESLAAEARRRLLVLDGIQDPGNVGTLVRTAAALGAGAVVALTGTADLWNAKVVRAAAGAHFHVPTVTCTPDALVRFLRAHDVPLWGAAAAGTPLDRLTAPERVALAVGNEGAGLSAPMRAAATLMVGLPMAAGVESLNVAVAAGIILYALRR